MTETLADLSPLRPVREKDLGRNSASVLLHDALSSQELAERGETTRVVSVKHGTPPRAVAWGE
jgi:hypothetical protein